MLQLGIVAGYLVAAGLVLYAAGVAGGTWKLNREHRERERNGGR